MSTHHVPNPSPYNGFEKFRLFCWCSSLRDGLHAPDPFSRMAAQIPVPRRWLLLIYNIIFCQRQVLVERPTLTSEMVEQSCGFQCFCTKPQGNMGGTKPLEPLMRKKRSRNANFSCLSASGVPPAFCGTSGKHGFFMFFTSLWYMCRHTFLTHSFFVARWLTDLVCDRAMYRLGLIDAFAEPRRL